MVWHRFTRCIGRSLATGVMLGCGVMLANANEIIIPFALAPPNPAESAPVEAAPLDLMLCLAADVSESVTAMEYELQKQGHAAAIEDEAVISIIRNGVHGRIGVVYVEWADQNQQHLAADWHVIEDKASAAQFAESIRTSSQPPWINWNVRNTSTSEVVRYCMRQFDRHTNQNSRRVIDISSDGTNNVGHRIDGIRDHAVAQGVTINVLAIEDSLAPFPNGTHTRPDGGLVRYFKNNVAGGAGAFVHAASGYSSFGEMIKRKFLLELASLN